MAKELTEQGLSDERAIPQHEGVSPIALSSTAISIQDTVRRPPNERIPVGYDRSFLDSDNPNVGSHLSDSERAHLSAIGQSRIAPQPPGAFAKYVLHRLLIDLAWNSSRLEGNSYSLRDARRLLEFGVMAKGRSVLETQMILNHKYAIEFLVNAAANTSIWRPRKFLAPEDCHHSPWDRVDRTELSQQKNAP